MADKDWQDYQDYLAYQDYQSYLNGSYSAPTPPANSEPSVNELLGNPQSRGQAARLAGTGQVIKSIPFGVGDEIFGGLGAGYDYLRGKGNTYNQRVEQARNLEAAASKISPFISGAGELAANLALPIKSSVGLKTGALAKTAQATKEGAALGAAYGFGEGEGGLENRGKSAITNALIGGATGGTLTAAGQTLGWMGKKGVESAKALNRKSIGTRVSDYTRKAQTVELPDGDIQTLTRNSLDDLLEKGALGKSRDPQTLVKITREKSRELATAVDDVVRNNNKSVKVSFDRAENLLREGGIPADKVPLYRNRLKKIKEVISTEGNNELLYLQQQKIALGKMYDPSDSALNTFNRAIYHDLQKTIEQHAPDVIGLNKELQKYKIAGDIVERSLASKEASDLATGALQTIRTSGGVVAPIIAGSAMGSPLAGVTVAGAVKLSQTPNGKRVLASGIKGLSKLSEGTGSKLIENTNPIVRALLSSTPKGQQRNNPKETQGSNFPTAPYQRNYDKPRGQQGQPVIDKERISLNLPSSNRSTILGLNQYKSSKLLDALAKTESNNNPNAISPAGAKGKYQFMDSTAKAYGLKNPFDPVESRKIAAILLQDEFEALGSIPLALAAYNTGRPNVLKAIKRAGSKDWSKVKKYLAKETQDYVPKINNNLAKILGEG